MTKKKSGHSGSFKVLERGDDQIATKWGCSCDCGNMFVGASYEATEGEWRQHHYALTGTLLNPAGDKSNRWTP